jgi:ribosomal protein S18 acetylase RimI-like enzyme
MAVTIRPLTPADAELFLTIRREALEREPLSFAASPGDDRASSFEFVRAALEDPNQAVFGAFAGGLVGVVGIYRDRTVKAGHKAHIWGMYVSAGGRGAGTGRKLMEAALEFARELPGVRQVHLVVSERTPVARGLYHSLGFRTWGVEPSALNINGELVDDEHMVLLLNQQVS